MRPFKILNVAAAISLLSSVANAGVFGLQGYSVPKGPLQNYCEWKCLCEDGPSPGYIQIFISPGASCNGAPSIQADSQCNSLCTPFTPTIIYYGGGVVS